MTEETEVAEAAEVESPSTEEATADVPESPSGETSDEAEPKESTSAEKAEDEADPQEWKNLIKKYNGDKEKAGKAYWKAVNDNAALAKENKELKAFRDAAEKAKNEKPSEPPAALKEVDDYINARTKALEKTLPQQEMKLFQEYSTQQKEVHRLEYELERADEVEKRSIKAELRVAQADLKGIERDIRETQQKADTAEREIQKAREYRKNVEKQLEDQARAKQEQEAKLADFMEDFPNEIDGYIAKYVKEFNFPEDQLDELKEDVYSNLIGYAAGFKDQAVDADRDWDALVKAQVKRESAKAERYGRSHFAKVSKEKKAVAAPAVGKPAPKPSADKSQKQDDGLTPAMARARAYLASKGL